MIAYKTILQPKYCKIAKCTLGPVKSTTLQRNINPKKRFDEVSPAKSTTLQRNTPPGT